MIVAHRIRTLTERTRQATRAAARTHHPDNPDEVAAVEHLRAHLGPAA